MTNYLKSRNAKDGSAAENIAKRMLIESGRFAMVERIETGMKVLYGKGGRITAAFPIERVSGDFRAIIPGVGRSVLVEVKFRKDSKLSFSDFKQHQHDALNEHNKLGGVSIVIFVCQLGAVMRLWPISGLVKGKPMTWGELTKPSSPGLMSVSHIQCHG